MSKDMKLIMERFRKNLSEMPAGIGMPLKIGAATAAGAMEKKRMAAVAENVKFVNKLKRLGDKPEFIEIEPGDIKGGLGLEELSGELNGYTKALGLGYFFDYADEASPLVPVEGPDGRGNYEPIRVSPKEVSELVATVLKEKGLWTPYASEK